ncbi:MAG: hypothetical protein J6572_08545 [Gilliamella sp.]|nr:hypothetical protein [Gilliamella sp.]
MSQQHKFPVFWKHPKTKIQVAKAHLNKKSFNNLFHNQGVSITWRQYIRLLCLAKIPY